MEALFSLNKDEFAALLKYHVEQENIDSRFAINEVSSEIYEKFILAFEYIEFEGVITSLVHFLDNMTILTTEEVVDLMLDSANDEVVSFICNKGHYNPSTHCCNHHDDPSEANLIAITEMSADELREHLSANGIVNDVVELSLTSEEVNVIKFDDAYLHGY